MHKDYPNRRSQLRKTVIFFPGSAPGMTIKNEQADCPQSKFVLLYTDSAKCKIREATWPEKPVTALKLNLQQMTLASVAKQQQNGD